MSGPDFLDTNVFVYAYSHTHLAKQVRARALLEDALSGNAVTSSQVLAELAAVMLHKLSPKLAPADMLEVLDAASSLRVFTNTSETVRRAVEVHTRYGIHFYDGLIVAAAEQAGCSRIWSEDLSAGQTYFGITVENPFA